MRQRALILTFCWAAACAQQPRFYPDDPLLSAPPPRPVAKAVNRKLSDYWDTLRHLLATPGERQTAERVIPARAVNTLGDPYDSAWWERRHYWRPMSAAELKRGPGNQTPPAMDGPWTVVSAKTEGITPGFTILDRHRRRYFVKFDPASNPEIATGADQIALRIFYALGYHVPENYIVYFRPEILVPGPDVTLEDRYGHKRKMTKRDISEILMKVDHRPDGRYRATASMALPGKPIGPYRYFGTCADDPNDTVPHEHRRDLRGMHLACAWIDHDDSRSINTLDILADGPKGKYVRHYQLDFGSTLGSASDKANSPRSGGEYLFGWRQMALQTLTLGLAVPRWATAEFPDLPSVGRFESAVFDPETWVPEYPNPAFINRLPDDEFWMARQIAHFSDADLRAIVETAEYSDPRAAEWILRCLIERRDKIGRAVFGRVLPLDRFEMKDGQLVWEDVAASHGLGARLDVTVNWSNYENPGGGDLWVATLVAANRPGQLIRVYVRQSEVVGVERIWPNPAR
jgi:hypothetical protein